MNTTEKGDAFEDLASEVIENLLKRDSLGIMKEYARIYRKKAYYSEKRKDDIIFDLAIELWPPNATRYTMLVLIECKNYAHTISVNEVEEFCAKIAQVSGINTKGVFITNNFLQKSARNYADAQGLMLVRASSANDFEIILHKASKSDDRQTQFTFPDKNSLERQFWGRIEKVINKCFTPSSIVSDFNVPELTKDEIETLAEFELDKMDRSILRKFSLFSPKQFMEYLKGEYGIQIQRLPHTSPLLGAFDGKENIISVHPKIEGTRRFFFVLAHEFGHFVLHRNLKMDQTTYDGYDDPEYSFKTNNYRLTNPKNWIEWQANYFASSLILHKWPLMKRILSYQQRNNLRMGIIYLYDQPHSQREFYGLVKELSNWFEVSMTNIKYRLSDLKIVVSKSRLKTFGQIVEENKEELFI